ncbi:MAG: CD1871A family CXXC motif-containing protein [bacterium]|nr:CD1871A family CXXC motif-containing protein [bacterium]
MRIRHVLRRFSFFLLLLFFAVFIIGIFRQEISEVLNNAITICLACIGIQ